ncbi:MAG: hypothetical protein R6W78_11485 [Bacteroidales bacterium]
MAKALKIGICGSTISEENIKGKKLGFEIDCLLEESEKYFDKTILIDATQVIHHFDQQESKPHMIYNSDNLNDLNVCIFREISGAEEPIALLAGTLAYCGCDILDPPERFTGAPSGKMFDSLKGFKSKIMPATIFAFNEKSATLALKMAAANKMFPLILKPGRGKRGENVALVHSCDDGIIYISDFYHANPVGALVLQKYIEIADEYRGMVLGGRCLGLVKKIAAEGKVARNAMQGGTFLSANDADTEAFIEKHANKKGLVGVDVVRDKNGIFHYIESNRSPQWKFFQAATGINVAGKLLEYAVEKLNNSSVLF